MANLGKWGNRSATTQVMTTELNALANATATTLSAVVANQTNLDIYADVWLHLATLTATAGAYGTLYILPALDGAFYPSSAAAGLRQQTTHVLCTFALGTPTTTAQDIVVRNVVLPPEAFKLVYDNQAGVALNPLANTITFITYDVNLNA